VKTSGELAAGLAGLQQRTSDGVRETVGMLESMGQVLFFHHAAPEGERRRTGLVLCPSFFEVAMLQSAEAALTRAAAKAGFPAIYVQPAGVGDSAGDSFTCTVEDRVKAATAGFADLLERFPDLEAPCFFGPRIGGAVATLAAQRHHLPASVVLWDPSFDPDKYWRQVRRLARVASVVGRQKRSDDPKAQLEDNGATLVLGIPVSNMQLDDVRSVRERIDHGRIDGPAFVVSPSDSALNDARGVIAQVASGPVEGKSLGFLDIWRLGLRQGEVAVPPTIEWMESNLR